jgi:hypothetical protein
MAIKPDDCVIKIEDLVIGYETVPDWDRRPKQIPVYESYWTNFLHHVKETTDYKSGWDAYDKNFERQLKKFNATYKQTKKYDDRYVKFKNHSDLTFFVLKWS